MLAKVLTGAVVGMDGALVEVEVDIAQSGLPNFLIVGLPDTAVQEARERVRAAIRNSGLSFPDAPDHREPGARRFEKGRAQL
jgi:magnesium chelatase family protein